MFRRRNDQLEVLLVHPGGPFFARKDDGVWTIPKGEAAPGEDLLTRAQIEFEEEVGLCPENVQRWIDRAEFFTEAIARQKMKPAQTPCLDRLRRALQERRLPSRRVSGGPRVSLT